MQIRKGRDITEIRKAKPMKVWLYCIFRRGFKLPSYEGLVYCSVNLGRLERTKYKEAFSLNQIIIEPTFISTSKSRLIAMAFNGNTLFRMLSKTGEAIEKIAKFGVHNPPNEKEVLFRPNRPFRILQIEEDGQPTIITMEEV